MSLYHKILKHHVPCYNNKPSDLLTKLFVVHNTVTLFVNHNVVHNVIHNIVALLLFTMSFIIYKIVTFLSNYE